MALAIEQVGMYCANSAAILVVADLPAASACSCSTSIRVGGQGCRRLQASPNRPRALQTCGEQSLLSLARALVEQSLGLALAVADRLYARDAE